MWVVKCGGSLIGNDGLRRCLEVLSDYTSGLVVVPGGGVFADHVREQQPLLRYDDETAHRMALLAMDQFACYLHSLERSLVLCNSLASAEAVARRGDAALLQAGPELARVSLPASWRTTSDALAAYVAGRIDAAHLLLLKARGIDRDQAPARELSDDGYLDSTFPEMMETAAFGVWALGPDPGQLAETLRAPGPPAVRITNG